MITIIINEEKINEVEQEQVKEIILPPAKKRTVGKNLFAKHYTIANNLIEKGYQLARICEDKYNSEELVYWFYNTEGLRRDLRKENEKFDNQFNLIDDEIENFDIENIAEV